MSFASFHFLVFFTVVFAVSWRLANKGQLRTWFLLISSYYFYMSWNPVYALLIAGSTVVDFGIGLALAKTDGRRLRQCLLAVSLVFNLGLLFVFKYYNFFVGSVVPGLWPGLSGDGYLHSLLLPVGISFYTFQTLSYTIDVYRRRLEPMHDLAGFALFVSFFPQLVAGPIVRASTFLPQLEKPPVYRESRVQSGFALILIGLAKKLLLADMLGRGIVDPIFADPGQFDSLTLLIAAYAYAFQIYYDFSGYSDVAIGAGRMVGFTLPKNFDHPYRAASLREFWHRWHISLSTWLRDYLYIPLGGSRFGARRTAINLAIVMVLGGLWHGAAWGFIVWGAIHGIVLGIERMGRYVLSGNGPRSRIDSDKSEAKGSFRQIFERVGRICLTFHVVVLCFIFFRCTTLSESYRFLAGLMAFDVDVLQVSTPSLVVLLVAASMEWIPFGRALAPLRIYRRLPIAGQAISFATALLVFMVFAGENIPFIYFQF